MVAAGRLPPARLAELLEEATEALREAARRRGGYLVNLDVTPETPIAVVGDIHGDADSLNYVLSLAESRGILENGVIVFLGDYVDRGPPGGQVEVIARIASLLLEYGHERVVPLRGNHEPPEGFEPLQHDYINALTAVYGSGEAHKLYSLSRKLFEALPHAAIASGVAVFLHGGLPVEGFEHGVEVYLAATRKPWTNFIEVLWNDPSDYVEEKSASPRGLGRLFGPRVTRRALDLLKVKRVVRGHEPAMQGYKFNHDGNVITLFSRLGAPYYNEAAAAMLCDSASEIASSPEACIVTWRT